MGFSAGLGFIVDTDGDGSNDGKVVTLKKGSNITLSLTGSTLTISGTSSGSGSVRTVTVDGIALESSESLDLVSGEGIDLSESGGDVTIAGEDATASNKGIASFSSDNFAVSSGAVTIKAGGVDLTAEVTGTLPVANGGTGANSLANLITLGTHTTGSYVATITGGTGIDSTAATSGEGTTHTLSIDDTVATKTYVDSVAQGLSVSDPVVVASTANITLENQQTIDGESVVAGNRVLVKDQTDATKNGIYLCVNSGSWTRATDMNSDNPNEFPGTFVFVTSGTTNGDTGWVCTVDTDFDLDTDNVTFSQFSSAGHITAGTNLTKSGNTLNVADAFLKNDASDVTTGTITAGGFTTAGSITLGGHAVDDIDVATEFTDSDNHLMTSAAIDDRILSYGYTTHTGDITGVLAGTGLTGGGTSGTVTLTNTGVTSIVAGSNITISSATGAVTIAATDTNTQTAYTPSVVDSSNDALIRLTASGAGSGTQDIKLVAGSNITLTPDATTTPQQITIASSGGLSGGTANRIAIWTGSTSMGDNSAFNWSGTTPAGGGPLWDLQLGTSSASTPRLKLYNDENVMYIGVSQGNNLLLDSAVDGDAVIVSNGAHPLILGANNEAAIEITATSMVKSDYSIYIKEAADAHTDVAGYGQFWVDSDDSTAKFTSDDGTDFYLTRRPVTAGGNSLADAETLAIAAGSNMSISESGGTVTFASTAAGSGITGITVQEEGSSLATVGTTLNFVGSAVTASGTGSTKTITISAGSGGGAFARSGNIIKTTETIGVGGSNVEEFALSDGGSVNSEAVMTNSGTNASVTTHGMGMRKNVTIVVPDADTVADTYTVADTDHIIMLCNVQPSDSTQVQAPNIKVVQLPAIGSTYVGREITVTLHALSGANLDNINVKPASDDVILYHGRMWDNNQGTGDHSDYASAAGGLGMTMGHLAATDVNWAVLGQASVVSVTMIAVDHGRLSTLLGGGNPFANYSADPSLWNDGGDAMTADIWLVTQVSGQNDLHTRTALVGNYGTVGGLEIDALYPRLGGR